MANEQAINRAVRHKVLLEQYTNSEIKEMQKMLKRVEQDLVLRLSREEITIESNARFRELLKDVRALLKTRYSKFTDGMLKRMEKLAPVEAEFEKKSLNTSFGGGLETRLPSPEQLNAAIFSKPLEGRFLKDIAAEWSDAQRKQVEAAITDGYYKGETTQNIVRQIRGTRANNFKDGILGGQTNRSATTLVRTAVNHTSNQAQMSVLKANDDIVKGWRFVNTLDSRTSVICASQDPEKVWPIGKGPIPPLHPNCRSTMVFVPSIDIPQTRGATTRASKGADGPKPVPANQSYSTWLKNQPAAFQDEALGKTRAALFRRGKLPIEKFTNDANRVLTLDELKKKYPTAFEEANLN